MIKKQKTNSKSARTSMSKDIPDKLPVKSLKSMNKNRSFVFYGRSGSGKTTLSLSFPGKILLLDIKDRGTDSVADIPSSEAVGMSVESWEDFEMVYYYLLKNPEEYATIVLDTMSQLQQLCVEHVIGSRKSGSKALGEWGTLTKGDWGDVSSLMKQWITQYRDLQDIGIEVVFIAQDRVFNMEDEDPDTMLTPEVGPRLTPSVASHLNAAVSVIGYTFIREKTLIKEVKGKKKEIKRTEYCLRIGPNPVFVTKARKPKHLQLPDVIVDPTYDSIIDILTGE